MSEQEKRTPDLDKIIAEMRAELIERDIRHDERAWNKAIYRAIAIVKRHFEGIGEGKPAGYRFGQVPAERRYVDGNWWHLLDSACALVKYPAQTQARIEILGKAVAAVMKGVSSEIPVVTIHHRDGCGFNNLTGFRAVQTHFSAPPSAEQPVQKSHWLEEDETYGEYLDRVRPDVSEYNKAFLDTVEHGEGFMKDGKHIPREEVFQPPILDDIVDAIINEHDMNVPDDLLAAPEGFGAHREAMRAALQKIIPLTLHIEAEYKRAMKRESNADELIEIISKRRTRINELEKRESGTEADIQEAVRELVHWYGLNELNVAKGLLKRYEILLRRKP